MVEDPCVRSGQVKMIDPCSLSLDDLATIDLFDVSVFVGDREDYTAVKMFVACFFSEDT